MFISVVLPAPFSPSSARISPRRSSRSMPWLATSAPNRLPIPDSERTMGALGSAATCLSGRRLRLRIIDVDAEHAVQDLLFLVLDELHHVGRHELVVDREARAAMRHEAVRAIIDRLEMPVDHRLDGAVDA